MGTLSPESITISVVSRSEWDSLGHQIHGGHVERQKPGLRHALSARLGVRGQYGMLFRPNLEFVVERVMQDFFHVVPILFLLGSRGTGHGNTAVPSIFNPPWAGKTA